jgi:hypothetical protein
MKFFKGKVLFNQITTLVVRNQIGYTNYALFSSFVVHKPLGS